MFYFEFYTLEYICVTIKIGMGDMLSIVCYCFQFQMLVCAVQWEKYYSPIYIVFCRSYSASLCILFASVEVQWYHILFFSFSYMSCKIGTQSV